jgi:hypothetical protein
MYVFHSLSGGHPDNLSSPVYQLDASIQMLPSKRSEKLSTEKSSKIKINVGGGGNKQ